MMSAMKHIEDDHQIALFRWAAMRKTHDGNPLTDYMFAIPNGGRRNPREAARLKKMGVKAGVSDIFLPIPRNNCHGLWIELKAPKGRISPEQKAWIDRMQEQGYAARVCFGWEAARIEIEEYLA